MRLQKPLILTAMQCGFLIFGGVLAYLVYHIHVVNLGYEMGQMQKQKKELDRIHTELQIEIASLASLDRIEQIAVTRLGMTSRDSNQKIRVTALDQKRKTPSVELAEREVERKIIK
jgi:cell division protein FtsL